MRPRLAVLLAAPCAGAAACFPAVTHGPRVEPGLAAGLTAAYTRGPTHVEGDEGGIRLRSGVVGAYGGYGWTPASARAPRLYLAVAVPILFPHAQVDAFVQAPPAWTGALATGAGVVASVEGVHVYGQAGRVSDRGMGWYLTGGYGRRESWSTEQSSSPAWFGAAAVQLAAGHARAHLFVQGADGRIPGQCGIVPGGGCARGERARAVAVGATVGWARRRVGRD